MNPAGRPVHCVFDVVGDANNRANVGFDTCEAEKEGFDTLCTVWSGPDIAKTIRECAWTYPIRYRPAGPRPTFLSCPTRDEGSSFGRRAGLK